MTVKINGDDALQLVKEMKRASLHAFPLYNHEGVRNVLREMRELFDQAQAVIHSGAAVVEGSANMVKLLMIHLSLKRSRRCLLAYHQARLEALLCYMRSPTCPSDFARSKVNLQADNLNAQESAFVKSYRRSLDLYRRHFPELSLFTSMATPPRSLFVQIRVLDGDCGTIETERGSLCLSQHSLHFVRYTDVEHLIAKGAVKVVE